MSVEIYSEDLPFDPVLMSRAHQEWARFPKRIGRDLPKGAKKFLGRRPGAELGDNEFSDTHFQFVLLMALCGQRESLVPWFRGHLLVEEALKPARSTKMESRRAVNRWCARRVGLSGWLIVAERTEWMNAHGWSEQFLETEIDWCARLARARLGLPLEQPVLVEDPGVELPVEFTGFVTG